MRIVVIIPYFVDAWAYGGQPRSAFEMAKALVALGHTVDVLTTDSAGPERLPQGTAKALRVVEGISIRSYRNVSNTLAYRGRFFFPPQFFRDLRDRLSGADVVHIHELRTLLAAAAAAEARRQSIPVVLSPHGGLRHLGRRALKTAFDALCGTRTLRRVDAVVAASPTEVDDARLLGVSESAITVVPNCIPSMPESISSASSFRERYRLPHGRIVLFLGRLHRIKGADLLVEAFARLQDQREEPVQLVLAGPDDGEEARLRKLVQGMNLGGRVTFTGFLDATQKFEALAASVLVVVPSRSEVFAITALEALLCERPVLLSSVCGLHPMPGPENGVVTFKSESIEDLAAQMALVLTSETLGEAARSGRQFVEREFSSEVMGHRLETLYRGVIRTHGQK